MVSISQRWRCGTTVSYRRMPSYGAERHILARQCHYGTIPHNGCFLRPWGVSVACGGICTARGWFGGRFRSLVVRITSEKGRRMPRERPNKSKRCRRSESVGTERREAENGTKKGQGFEPDPLVKVLIFDAVVDNQGNRYSCRHWQVHNQSERQGNHSAVPLSV